MFTKEAAEGEEAGEPSEEESEQGPEPLSTLDKDAEVDGIEAWTPIFSSTNSGVKNQVILNDTWQSIEFTVQGREPDQTFWLESTGECVWQQKAADQCLAQRKL